MEIVGKEIITQEFDDTPLLTISLKLPTGNWSPNIRCIVDTGYSGEVLLSSNLFQIWSNKMERAIDDADIGESVTGEVIQLRSVDSKIKIGDMVFSVVISSFPTIAENLVGWSVLEKFLSVFKRSELVLFTQS